jgi:glycosyltransferase involved in cell wall biosynthesis
VRPLAEPPSTIQTAILLSVFNGERFLPAQLESLLAQTHRSWRLYWRDDGSVDASADLMRAFAAGPAAGRVTEVPRPAGRLGVTRSFLTLLAAAPPAEAVAYADQDDVWMPEKLARGIAALAGVPFAVPALYCARQTLVDADLTRIGVSFRLDRPPGFPAALTQNIATGCTAMLNRRAGALIARSRPPPGTLHDWWSYLVVAAAGGRIIADPEPVVLYRQHGGNLVGARDTWLKRAYGALRRGPRPFMRVLRHHVAALAAEPDLLSPEAARALAVIAEALALPAWRRLPALALPGFLRQTPLETALFRLWFLLG